MTAYYVMWAIICLGIIGICGFGLRRGYSWVMTYLAKRKQNKLAKKLRDVIAAMDREIPEPSSPDEETFLALAKEKYDAVQKWREESGSKERFKDKHLSEEYRAQLPNDHPIFEQERRDREIGKFTLKDPDPTFVYMIKDGWYYPPPFRY